MIAINTGDVFYGTNANLLNNLGLRTQENKPFKNWYKCTYDIDENTFIWMISIDGKERNGWINKFQDSDTIIERHIKDGDNGRGVNFQYRLVFDKVNNNDDNKFIFRGMFELQSESVSNRRILKKVADIVELD